MPAQVNALADLQSEKTVAICISLNPKPHNLAKLKLELKRQAHPIIRKAKGFRGHTLLISPDEDKAIAISLWEPDGNNDAYKDITSKAVSSLENLIEGRPKITVCDILDGKSADDHALETVVKMVGKSNELLILEVSNPFFHTLLSEGLA
jgi:hypothetical protein